ncbi:MAG: hypothetical protein AVDCRST_MAG33-543, partial [uncultured Thermomicrobiales bacterium]
DHPTPPPYPRFRPRGGAGRDRVADPFHDRGPLLPRRHPAARGHPGPDGAAPEHRDLLRALQRLRWLQRPEEVRHPGGHDRRRRRRAAGRARLPADRRERPRAPRRPRRPGRPEARAAFHPRRDARPLAGLGHLPLARPRDQLHRPAAVRRPARDDGLVPRHLRPRLRGRPAPGLSPDHRAHPGDECRSRPGQHPTGWRGDAGNGAWGHPPGDRPAPPAGRPAGRPPCRPRADRDRHPPAAILVAVPPPLRHGDLQLRRPPVQRSGRPADHAEHPVLLRHQECRGPACLDRPVATRRLRSRQHPPRLQLRGSPRGDALPAGVDPDVHQQPDRFRPDEQRGLDRCPVADTPQRGWRPGRCPGGQALRRRRLRRYVRDREGDRPDHHAGLQHERRAAAAAQRRTDAADRAGAVRREEHQVDHRDRGRRLRRQGVLRAAGLGPELRPLHPLGLLQPPRRQQHPLRRPGPRRPDDHRQGPRLRRRPWHPERRVQPRRRSDLAAGPRHLPRHRPDLAVLGDRLGRPQPARRVRRHLPRRRRDGRPADRGVPGHRPAGRPRLPPRHRDRRV